MPRRHPRHDPLYPHGFLPRTPPLVIRIALIVGVL